MLNLSDIAFLPTALHKSAWTQCLSIILFVWKMRLCNSRSKLVEMWCLFSVLLRLNAQNRYKMRLVHFLWCVSKPDFDSWSGQTEDLKTVRANSVPSHRGAFVGLFPKQSTSQMEIWNTTNQWRFYDIFNIKPPTQTQSPPSEDFLATVLCDLLSISKLKFEKKWFTRGAAIVSPSVQRSLRK